MILRRIRRATRRSNQRGLRPVIRLRCRVQIQPPTRRGIRQRTLQEIPRWNQLPIRPRIQQRTHRSARRDSQPWSRLDNRQRCQVMRLARVRRAVPARTRRLTQLSSRPVTRHTIRRWSRRTRQPIIRLSFPPRFTFSSRPFRPGIRLVCRHRAAQPRNRRLIRHKDRRAHRAVIPRSRPPLCRHWIRARIPRLIRPQCRRLIQAQSLPRSLR